MKIVCISDTHGLHSRIAVPPGDMLIDSGDCTPNTDSASLIDFLKWLESQPHKHKILVAGNHDGIFETRPEEARMLLSSTAPSCIYLQDSGTVIDGLKIWGSPVTPRFFDWHFNRSRGEEIRLHWDMIPDNVDVLVTHGPAYGRLDRVLRVLPSNPDFNQGCADLARVIDTRLRSLKLHVFGHLHLQGNSQMTLNGVTYVNAACVDEKYRPAGTVQVVDISSAAGP